MYKDKRLLMFFLVIILIVSFCLIGCKEAKIENETTTESTVVTEENNVVNETTTESTVVTEESNVEDKEVKELDKLLFIVKGMDATFWQKMIEGAEQAGKDLGFSVEGKAPVKSYDVEEQIRIIEEGIAQNVDAIVVVAADSKGIIPGIEKANEAGIPVGTSNTKVDGGEIIGWAGADNFEAAYEVAKFLINKMGNKGNLVILEGTPGNQTATDRKAGFDKAISESDVEVIASQTANFVYEDGLQVMENLLQQFDNIDAVLAANDPMAIGAIEAITAAGRENIMVGGFNGDDDAIKAIKDGKMIVTTAQVPESQAYWSVLQVYMYLKGMPVPKEIDVPTKMITVENLNK